LDGEGEIERTLIRPSLVDRKQILGETGERVERVEDVEREAEGRDRDK
jgi:hypothetical protein